VRARTTPVPPGPIPEKEKVKAGRLEAEWRRAAIGKEDATSYVLGDWSSILFAVEYNIAQGDFGGDFIY